MNHSQRQVAMFVRDFQMAHKRSPKCREVSNALNIGTTQAWKILKLLNANGVIVWDREREKGSQNSSLTLMPSGTPYDDSADELIPVQRNTGMIRVRSVDGELVLTFNDIADGLQRPTASIRNAYSANKSQWLDNETRVSEFQTPSGEQMVRLFTVRGAMRFCRHVGGERSDALFNHLLDLFEQERNGQQRTPQSFSSEQMIQAIYGLMDRLAVKTIDAENQVNNVKRQQEQMQSQQAELRRDIDVVKNIVSGIDAKELGRQARQEYKDHERQLSAERNEVHILVDAVVARAKKTQGPIAANYDNHQKVWRKTHNHVHASKKDDYALEDCQSAKEFLRGILRSLGGNPAASLFDF